MWSVDISEFAHRYDSLPLGYRWPLFDDLLPAYEEHEFDWQGREYGAGFCWGLFVFVAEIVE